MKWRRAGTLEQVPGRLLVSALLSAVLTQAIGLYAMELDRYSLDAKFGLMLIFMGVIDAIIVVGLLTLAVEKYIFVSVGKDKHLALKRPAYNECVDIVKAYDKYVGTRWQHYSTGQIYIITAVSMHTEDYTVLIHYMEDGGTFLWSRPAEVFFEEISEGVNRFNSVTESVAE